MKSFGIQIKPVGSNCNLKCKYCYAAPFSKDKLQIMSEEILEAVVKKFFQYQKNIFFSWHGGEPLIPGIEFYQKFMLILNKYKTDEHKIQNLIQTNATLITDEFAKFFKDNDFKVSISLDGTQKIHDTNRIYQNGIGSFNNVMKGVEILRKYGINPPVIITVTKEFLKHPKEVFEFVVSNGFKEIKFSPVFDSFEDNFSINADEWFLYLKDILHCWLELNNPEIIIRELDEVIAWLSNKTINLCSSNKSCLNWISVDPEGSLYPCEYLRSLASYGNISDIDLLDLQKTIAYKNFKKVFLQMPEKCKLCDFYRFCGNGCPATRVKDGLMAHDGVFVYCEQRKNLYEEIKKFIE